MRYRSLTCLPLACLLLLAAPLRSGSANPQREKNVWNYDGGLTISTEGKVPNGPCFHLSEHVTADNFFENLRRVDTASGTIYRRGNDIVTEFPELMHLSFTIYDQPCSEELQTTGTRLYLNRAIVGAFRIGFAWKRGIELRPAREIKLKNAEARLIPPYAQELAEELPKKYEWVFQFDVPSKGVPLTDSLVLVIHSPDGHIIARVAGRV
jgi:hypothetical protein